MGELSRILGLVGWGAVAVLCAFLWLVARLFQRRTGLRTRPALLALAGGLLAGGGLLESIGWPVAVTNATSALLAAAGVFLAAAVLRVYGLMVGRLP